MAGKPINFPSTVAPGQTVDLAVSLVAPTLPGSYRGEWILKNPLEASFGAGANGTTPIWVTINVIPVTITTTVISPSRITGHVSKEGILQSGFLLTLDDSNANTQPARTVTDNTGMYTFSNLSAGTYYLKWIGGRCPEGTEEKVLPVNVNAGETKIQDLEVGIIC